MMVEGDTITHVDLGDTLQKVADNLIYSARVRCQMMKYDLVADMV